MDKIRIEIFDASNSEELFTCETFHNPMSTHDLKEKKNLLKMRDLSEMGALKIKLTSISEVEEEI